MTQKICELFGWTDWSEFHLSSLLMILFVSVTAAWWASMFLTMDSYDSPTKRQVPWAFLIGVGLIFWDVLFSVFH